MPMVLPTIATTAIKHIIDVLHCNERIMNVNVGIV